MVITDHTEPTGVVDRLLWRDGQTMLGRHARPDHDGKCAWCGSKWPCPRRRLAQRAEVASRPPWRQAWTAPHAPNGLRALPGRRDNPGRPGRWGPTNRGPFD